jgi:hypothetical protein
MSDKEDLEQRLSRYRPAGPSAEFEGRLLRATCEAQASAISPLGLPGYGFALAASVLIVAGLSFALAGRIEMGRLRALVNDSRDATAVRESERMLELEFGPEMLEFERQLVVTRAAARSLREPSALDPAAREERQ